jgi:membrane protease YdiL (CAAX protease family)
MNPIVALIKRRPLVAYFVLAYALTWSMVLLTRLSLLFAFLGLFGPAAAALIVTAIDEGRAGVRALLQHVVQWRVGALWYAVALGLPILLGLVVAGLHTLLGGAYTFRPGGPLALSLVLGVLVLGEELGWRGYALPRLQARFGGLAASVILGALWAAWHLANVTIPGLERYGYGFSAFALFVIAQTILFTWIANNTRASVLLAWLFHAAINAAGSQLSIGDELRQWWLSGAVYGVAALIVVLVAGPQLGRQPLAGPEAIAASQPLA